MEGKIMIKNMIILSLLFVIITGISAGEFLDYVQIGLDKLGQLVYTVKSEVNNI
jgi:hypothetical protein|tara:strand:- start:22 stop:183 length:162 start_codon:yes stop_codon:yes gene_type:complete